MTALFDRVLAKAGMTREEIGPRTALGKTLRGKGVGPSDELGRITALPRRPGAASADAELAAEVTRIYRAPGGTMDLRPIQAFALLEASYRRGLLAQVRVGGGKTLVSLLAPEAMACKRPVLIVPAKLRDKTLVELEGYHRHFAFEVPTIVSYETLGREKAADLLDRLAPDCIVTDESHRLKNPRAAVTRRVRRYLEAHPGLPFIAMSGTIVRRSLLDFAHLSEWALGAGSPVPRKWTVVQEWSLALDEGVDALARIRPGRLAELMDPAEHQLLELDPLSAARRAVSRRIMDTEGVVATDTPDELGCSLRVEAVALEQPDEIRSALHKLRGDWETPAGVPIADAVSLWRHARELSLGFCYRWAPPPPQAWLEARRAWCARVRHVIKHGRQGIDSEGQLASACGHPRTRIDRDTVAAWADWTHIRKTYEPTTVADWISDAAVDACVEWLAEGEGGIVWTEHTAFGERVAERAGVPYVGAGGLVAGTKRTIESLAGAACVASVQSSGEGRNLQDWKRALVASAPPNGAAWEQLLGRLHRPGQTADEVAFDVLVGCVEVLEGLDQVRRDATYAKDQGGQEQKVLTCDWLVPAATELGSQLP